jgi:hypothetical protein
MSLSLLTPSKIFLILCITTPLFFFVTVSRKRTLIGKIFLAWSLAFGTVPPLLPQNEPVVLLTLLRLPHKDEPSMADIYGSCRDIPQDIIFANSPRLQLDGFRWAPSTFLIRWSHPSGKSNRSGVVTSREFQLQKDCVLLGNEALEIYDNIE